MKCSHRKKTRSNKMQANTISNANRNAIDGVEKNSTHLNDSINYSLVFNDFIPHLASAKSLMGICEAFKYFFEL